MFNMKLSLEEFVFSLRDALGKPRFPVTAVRHPFWSGRVALQGCFDAKGSPYRNDLNFLLLDCDPFSESDIAVYFRDILSQTERAHAFDSYCIYCTLE